VLSGTHLFALNLDGVSEYQASTGGLIRRVDLDRSNTVELTHLALGRGLIIAGGIGCDSVSDPNGYISAVDSLTGAPVWDEFVGPGLGDLVESGPYVVSAGGTFASGNYLSVLNADNGSQVWGHSTDCGSVPVVVAQGEVIAATCDSDDNQELAAFTLKTGDVAWSRSGNWHVFMADDATEGARVYATNPNGHIVALSAQTGQRLYRLHGAKDVLAVDGSQLYASCGSSSPSVCAYDTTTGAVTWTATAQPATLASVGGGVIYLSDGSALSTKTGAVLTTLWSGETATSLAVGDGRLAVTKTRRGVDLYGLRGD
jgi:outer membrane protein assembly factor BamB